jgi:flagellar biosynthesis anti-sigma factor FlgM
MKINGNGPNPSIESRGVDKTGAVRNQSAAGTPSADGAAHTDTVQLSSQAQLAERLRQAVASGAETDGVRADRVEQARQKLAAGQVGSDPMALADRLIEHMLEG